MATRSEFGDEMLEIFSADGPLARAISGLQHVTNKLPWRRRGPRAEHAIAVFD